MNSDKKVCFKFPTTYTLINLTRWNYDNTKNREECNFLAAIRENTIWEQTDYIIAIPDKHGQFIKRFNAPSDYTYEPTILTTLESSIIITLNDENTKPGAL